ncbi:putative RNA methyltransferase [Glutamicibacter endophyticus]|uniref:putative RNA methyltransferase n=1 Tax=Glutamicibacter endophyticus TaxID=1522174 RepID=UPI003AF07FF9
MRATIDIYCPICQTELHILEGSRATLACDANHRFDPAKQGYYNFLTGAGTKFLEDTAPMVAARERFQATGHYSPLAQELIERARAIPASPPSNIVDAGAGTGYYLGEILQANALPEASALALDISRYAMRRAAKLPKTTAVVWDLWRRLPAADGSCDLVLNCFAPHNPAEFARVLRPTGRCIVVTGLPDHLQEVREPLGMLGIGGNKRDQLLEKFSPAGLELLDEKHLRHEFSASPQQLADLAFMGPAGHHQALSDLEQIAAGLGPQTVTAAFGIYVFGHRS